MRNQRTLTHLQDLAQEISEEIVDLYGAIQRSKKWKKMQLDSTVIPRFEKAKVDYDYVTSLIKLIG